MYNFFPVWYFLKYRVIIIHVCEESLEGLDIICKIRYNNTALLTRVWMPTVMKMYRPLLIISGFLLQEWKCLKMQHSLWFKSTGRLETHDTCSASSDDGWLCWWVLDRERLWSSLPYHTHTDAYTLTYRSLATIQSAEEVVGRGNLEMFRGSGTIIMALHTYKFYLSLFLLHMHALSFSIL